MLEAAETLLRQNGPDAVNVRAVATSVGLTDAAVNHHFGTRQDLLEALLRHGGRRLKAELNAALLQWQRTDHSVQRLVEIIVDLYSDGGYAELALRLHLSGWRDRGAGLLSPVVDALHDMRLTAFAAAGKSRPSIFETQFIVGLMHQNSRARSPVRVRVPAQRWHGAIRGTLPGSKEDFLGHVLAGPVVGRTWGSPTDGGQELNERETRCVGDRSDVAGHGRGPLARR